MTTLEPQACVCGTVLPLVHSGGGRQRQYCSDRCRQKAKRDRDSASKSVKRDIATMLNTVTIGDSRELAKGISDHSIDLIFTDPPYCKEHIQSEIYAWLAQEASRVLKPGALCFAYTYPLWLPHVLEQMGRHLTYHWVYMFTRQGMSGLEYHKQTVNRYTPIVCFSKGKPAKHTYVLDVLQKDSGRDKRFHKWGQSEDSARYYIEKISSPGDTVWEPFTGGGTVPYVCKQLQRNFIAFEIDDKAATIARKRLETFQPLLMDEQTHQMELGA